LTYHATNKNNREIIIASIPWNPATYTNRFQAGDWISRRNFRNNTTLEWIYHVTGVTPNTVQANEFQRVIPTGFIRAMNSQVITLSPEGYHPIRVLLQERHGAPYIVAKEFPSLTKLPILWIFESGFIDGLPWDPREWHWQASSQMGDSPFFGFRKMGLPKCKETHPECQHLLLHSKAKPAKLHCHASYCQNLA
jgi:hypothetical protein